MHTHIQWNCIIKKILFFTKLPTATFFITKVHKSLFTQLYKKKTLIAPRNAFIFLNTILAVAKAMKSGISVSTKGIANEIRSHRPHSMREKSERKYKGNATVFIFLTVVVLNQRCRLFMMSAFCCVEYCSLIFGENYSLHRYVCYFENLASLLNFEINYQRVYVYQCFTGKSHKKEKKKRWHAGSKEWRK